MRTVLNVFLLATLLAFTNPQAGHADTQRFTVINVPGAINGTFPTGINARGQVVGSYYDQTGGHGFVLSNGVYKTIDVPGAAYGSTFPVDVNDSGEIVGNYVDSAFISHVFVLNEGLYTTLDAPGAAYGTVLGGLNNKGEIAGAYVDSAFQQHGFLFRKGVYTTLVPSGPVSGSDLFLAGINDRGDIVGSSSSIFGSFVLSDGVYTILANVSVNNLNDRGEIVGYFNDGTGGFVLRQGVYTTINVPGALQGSTQLSCINSHGQIVGTFYDSAFRLHGFLLTN